MRVFVGIFLASVYLLTAYSTVWASQPLLAGDREIDVVSYNMNIKCPDKYVNFIRQSMQQGNGWEIIGFQEMRHSEKRCFGAQQFIDEMKKVGITYYCKVQNALNVDDINVTICSIYPLNESSYTEIPIHSYGPRVMQCIEVLVPNNPLIFCNTHTKATAPADVVFQQLRTGINFIVNTVSYNYVPASVTDPAEKKAYRDANLARTIVVGDFNQGSKNSYPFVSACKASPRDMAQLCFFGTSTIDHITTADMTSTIIGAQPPLNQEYLQPLSFKRDLSLPWPTDHNGPVLAKINIKKLDIPIKSQKLADLDANSVVDIFDYNILLGKFGATGAAGFHVADIIQNGVVDIFDYNKLIENFGK